MLPKWERTENQMKFLGHAEAAAFIRERPAQAETVRAWLSEIKYRAWINEKTLAADFRGVDTTSPPRAIFRLGWPLVLVETIVDFRNGIVLLTGIRSIAEPSSRLA